MCICVYVYCEKLEFSFFPNVHQSYKCSLEISNFHLQKGRSVVLSVCLSVSLSVSVCVTILIFEHANGVNHNEKRTVP